MFKGLKNMQDSFILDVFNSYLKTIKIFVNKKFLL